MESGAFDPECRLIKTTARWAFDGVIWALATRCPDYGNIRLAAS